METTDASTLTLSQSDIAFHPLSYSLDLDCPVPWPLTQDDSINQDYPFACIDEESPNEFAIRRYLETLWLPESIMPLQHFVQSLRRLVSPPSHVGALYTAIKPLLLSVRATQDKYHVELPQILQDGGGAGEIEETMMWYAWSKENFEPEGGGKEAEDAWKKAWMERLERREVQIQILLYFHLLSLPQPPPITPAPSSTHRPLRKKTRGPPSPAKPVFSSTSSIEAAMVPSLPPTPSKSAKYSTPGIDETLGMEDRLEYFMDRLSLWQLVASLNVPAPSQAPSSHPSKTDLRDWMQKFCEDVVEPLFRDQLPKLCDLFRTKVFPHSPFSDDSDDASSPPPPDLRAARKGKAKEKRPTSPLRLQEVEKPRAGKSWAEATQSADNCGSGALNRHRSRSRSVSVSVEEVRARGASRGGVASSKTLFKGEVEMKRTSSKGSKLFKHSAGGPQSKSAKELTRQNSGDYALFSRARSTQPRSPSQSREPKMLAADTPVKKVVKAEEDIHDIVMDSPDALLLYNQRRCSQAGEEEEDGVFRRPSEVLAADTPVKKPIRRS